MCAGQQQRVKVKFILPITFDQSAIQYEHYRVKSIAGGNRGKVMRPTVQSTAAALPPTAHALRHRHATQPAGRRNGDDAFSGDGARRLNVKRRERLFHSLVAATSDARSSAKLQPRQNMEQRGELSRPEGAGGQVRVKEIHQL